MNTSIFEYLPYEIQLRIIFYLQIKDIGRLCSVSILFHSLCSEESLFKHLYWRDYGAALKKVDDKTWRERVTELYRQTCKFNTKQYIVWAALHGYPGVIYSLFKTPHISVTDKKQQIGSTTFSVYDILNDNGTILHIAENSGHVNVCEAVLKIAQKDKKLFQIFNSFHATPLTSAVFHEKKECVQFFLEMGADIEGRENKYKQTPLCIAVGKGSIEMVELLLKFKANPSVEDRDAYTPITIARYKRHDNILTILQKAIQNK